MKRGGYEKRLGEFNWLRWQLIRRHHDYRKFCRFQDKNFDESGELVETNLTCRFGEGHWGFVDLEDSSGIKGIKARFGLNTIYHYNKNFSEQYCFENEDLFNTGTRVVTRIFPETLSAPYSTIDAAYSKHEIREEYDPEHIYLKVKIDEGIPYKDIAQEFERQYQLTLACRKILSPGTKSLPFRRVDYKATAESLLIWDFLESGKKPADIARELWPEEWDQPENSSEADQIYQKLCEKYRNQKIEDWDERAYREAYSNSGNSGIPKLLMRIHDKAERIKNLINKI